MPFDDEEEDSGYKGKGTKLNNSKSMLSSLPKKPNPVEFEKKVKETQERISGYESEASDLAMMFKNVINDKTLAENRNLLIEEAEKELISKMADIAVKINNDENELEGMGSVGWIVLLLRTCLFQRDKINKLEYNLSNLDKKTKLLQDKLDLLPLVDNKKTNE